MNRPWIAERAVHILSGYREEVESELESVDKALEIIRKTYIDKENRNE